MTEVCRLGILVRETLQFYSSRRFQLRMFRNSLRAFKESLTASKARGTPAEELPRLRIQLFVVVAVLLPLW